MMYSFSSQKTSGAVHAAIILSYALGILLYAASGVEGTPYPIIFQSGTVILMALGTYLLFRFVFKKFTYDLSENGGRERELTVIETVGKKRTVVARLALNRISRVKIIDSKNLRAELAGDKKSRPMLFKYDARFAPAKVCLVEFPDENSVIIIPDDEKMYHLLAHYINDENSRQNHE